MSTHRRTPHVRRAAGAVAVALVTAAALAGCGVSSAVHSARSVAGEIHTLASDGQASATASTSAAAPAVDLCTLLTPAQASDLLHITYDTTETVSHGEFHGCTYHNTNTTDRGDTTNLTVTTTTSSGCWAAVTASDGPGTAVSGVGDAAFGTSLELDVKSGGRCLTVEGQTLAESNSDWSGDVAVAQLLLPQLGGS